MSASFFLKMIHFFLADNVSTSGSIATSLGYATLAGGNGIRMEFGTSFYLINTLSKLGIEVGKTTKEVIGGLVAGVSVIFIVTDIVSLVRDWQREHPTYDTICSIIESLREELVPIKELFVFFTENDDQNKTPCE